MIMKVDRPYDEVFRYFKNVNYDVLWKEILGINIKYADALFDIIHNDLDIHWICKKYGLTENEATMFFEVTGSILKTTMNDYLENDNEN